MAHEPTTSSIDDVLRELRDDGENDRLKSLADYATKAPVHGNQIAAAYLAACRRHEADDGEERVAHYRLIRELGRGGQAVVWLAEDEELHRQVALKLVRGAGPDCGRLLKRMQREAEITSKLDHPGICAVYEVGMVEVPFIAMRYVEGESLSTTIQSARTVKRDDTSSTEFVELESGSEDAATAAPEPGSGPNSTRELMVVVKLIEKAARALHAAHEAGVIHRDIKPGNIMVSADGDPVVLDFGLAKEEDHAGPSLTMTGDLMGTPAYMSPEQIAAQRITLDRRTDVYSLGVTLFECLTGTRPFERPTREALYNAIMTEEAPRVRRLNPAVLKDLEVVVETTLQKNRDHRYQTTLELAEDLRRVSEYEPIAARPAGPWTRVLRWGQRNPVVASMLVVVLLAVGSAAGIFAWKNAELTSTLVERDEAFGRVTAEKTRVQAEKARVQAEKERVTRLKDGRALRLHLALAETLYPARPDRIADMNAWLADTETLLASLPVHRTTLVTLEAKAGPYTDEQRAIDHRGVLSHLADAHRRAEDLAEALDDADSNAEEERLDSALEGVDTEIERLEAQIAVRKSWGFDDEKSWLHELLSDLVARLTELGKPGGLVADVRARLATAESIKSRTVDEHAESWKDALARIRVSKLYGKLVLKEHVGLIPLGPDPASGLEEFLHWESHARGTALPERDAAGRFTVGNDTGIIVVLLPGGTFRMGAKRPGSLDEAGANVDPEALPYESPVHDVPLSSFFLGKYELTRGQWVRMTGEVDPSNWNEQTTGGRLKEGELARYPLEQIDWLTSDRWLSRVGLTLPTEAQWEYGCRGGTGSVYFFGGDVSDLVTYGNIADRQYKSAFGSGASVSNDVDDGHIVVAPVGSYEPNGFGLFDVHGNLWEWCRDWYEPYGPDSVEPGTGLRIHQGSRYRVARGGSLHNPAVMARAASRDRYVPSFRYNNLGLRASRVITN